MPKTITQLTIFDVQPAPRAEESQEGRDRSAEIRLLLNAAERHEQYASPEARAAAQTARTRARELMTRPVQPIQPIAEPVKPLPEPVQPITQTKPQLPKTPTEMSEVAVWEGEVYYSAVANGRWKPVSPDERSSLASGQLVKQQGGSWAYEFDRIDGTDALARFTGHRCFIRRIPLQDLMAEEVKRDASGSGNGQGDDASPSPFKAGDRVTVSDDHPRLAGKVLTVIGVRQWDEPMVSLNYQNHPYLVAARHLKLISTSMSCWAEWRRWPHGWTYTGRMTSRPDARPHYPDSQLFLAGIDPNQMVKPVDQIGVGDRVQTCIGEGVVVAIKPVDGMQENWFWVKMPSGFTPPFSPKTIKGVLHA